MDFSINPNTYYLKTLRIVASCVTPYQKKVALRCIDLYDSKQSYFENFFKHSDLKPIVSHTGDYDHLTAVWILRKKLNYRTEK